MYPKIWIGYSGGVDSHVLLHVVSKNYPNVHAVYINHGLSANADSWQQHCKKICRNLNIPFLCINIKLTKQRGKSIEVLAREARYNVWKKLIKPKDILCVAHHADDQAETILYRLCRGTGPKGLMGIQEKTQILGITVVRPMLELHKKDILQYANENNLKWINDESNNNLKFDRNFIRNKVMPLLKQRWSIVNNFCRAGKLCNDIQTNIKTDDVLDLNFWIREILRTWLQKHKITPSLQQLSIIIKEVINARIDAQPKFIIGKKIIRRSKNKLYIVNQDKKTNYSGGTHAKKIFQKYDIPSWQRSNYKLVYKNGHLIEIVGLWCASKSDKLKS